MRFWQVMVIGAFLTGCGNAAQQEKIDELTKKVTTLEKRMKVLEGKGKAPKGKAAKGKAPKGKAPAAGPKAKVDVSGDASKILLSNGKRSFTLPGSVPAGEYKILAAFEAGAEPSEVGAITIAGEAPVTITCESGTKRCAAPTPE